MTVAELITLFRLRTTTERRREDPRHAHWWVEHLGLMPVADLSTARILEACEHLRTTGRTGVRSGSTVAFYLRFLRRVTAWATGALYLSVDPCAAIPLPKEPAMPMRVLTEDEEQQLCAALGRPYNLWVRFAILTGLEQSEQFTLLWRSVDLDRCLALVPQSTTGTLMELSLPTEAVTILKALRQDSPTSAWVFADPLHPTRPVDPHNFYVSRWTRTIERLGMARLAWKDLRHTCGVRLAKQGIPVSEIATFLRQREVRQAYRYRAWQPGAIPKKPQPNHPRAPVFADVQAMDLQALLQRDTTKDPLTLRELARLYAVHHLRDRPAREPFERIFRQFWQPWADRPTDLLTKKEVRIWYMGLAHIPGHANKAATMLRALYNWADRMELVTVSNPVLHLLRYRQVPRERFLSVEEVQHFVAGLPHLPLKPRAYLLLLLLTGARRSEALAMRWQDVDWPSRIWRKPHTKNGASHHVPLPVQVVEVLQQLPRRSEWVFPGDDGQHWSTASVEKLWGLVRRRWNLHDVRLHDLRRTCASFLAIAGENLPTIQNVLNHRSLTPTSIYARLNTKAVDRALQTQANFITALQCAPAHAVLALEAHGEMAGSAREIPHGHGLEGTIL